MSRKVLAVLVIALLVGFFILFLVVGQSDRGLDDAVRARALNDPYEESINTRSPH